MNRINVYKKLLKYIIALGITVLGIWLSFRSLDISVLGEAFKKIKLIWVLIALINSLISVYLLGIRWRILLVDMFKPSFNYLFKLNIISQSINMIIPGRFGEFARAYLLSRNNSISSGYVMGTIIIEKYSDLGGLVLVWILMSFLFVLNPMVKIEYLFVFIIFIAGLFLFLLVKRREKIKIWLTWMISPLPKFIKQKIVVLINELLNAIEQMNDYRKSIKVLILSVLIILSQGFTNYLLFLAFDIHLSIFEALVLLVILIIGSLPPAVPGRIGIFEYSVIIGLSFWGIPKGIALGYGLVLHLVVFLPKLILGGWYLINSKTSFNELLNDFKKLKESNV